MANAGEVERVPIPAASLGEGAVWNSAVQRLQWIDITGQRVFTYDPATGENRACDVGQMVGTVVPRRSGGLMLAVHEGIAALDPTSGRMDLWPRPPEHDPAVVRFNDGKCDPSGRFWAGTMALVKGPRPLGRLYRLDPDGAMHVMLTDVGTSNGVAWSIDRRTLYFIDTPLLRVDAFDYDDASGAITNRRTAISIPPGMGRPDGSTLDAEGMLWIAMYEGWGVTRWDPQTGKLLQTIRLPVARVTSCAFGGPGLDILYLTTARHNLSEEQIAAQPLAGSLFQVRPGMRGMPAFAFGG